MDNISNQATLLYNNTTTNSNTVTTQILSLYNLSATVTPLLDNYTPGKKLTYVSRIENTGSSTIYNLQVDDDLGNGVLNYILNSAKAFLNGNPISIETINNESHISFKIPNNLNPGDNVIIIFETETPTTNLTNIKNVQTIYGNGGSINGSTISVTPKPNSTVTLADYVLLNITKTANSTNIYDGDELIYTFEITNKGNESATNVTFSDSFLPGYTIHSITLLPANSMTPITYEPTSYISENELKIPNLTIPVGTNILTITGIYHH